MTSSICERTGGSGMSSGPMPSESTPPRASGSRRVRGVFRQLAFWRPKPGSQRGVGTLQLLAILGLVRPLLAAVGTHYSTQIIPDFDDSDWDGPGDGSGADEKSRSVWLHNKNRSHRTPSLASPPWGCVSSFELKSCETRMENRRPQMLSSTYRHPDLSRRPPAPHRPPGRTELRATLPALGIEPEKHFSGWRTSCDGSCSRY
jgi:hypothetical protein